MHWKINDATIAISSQNWVAGPAAALTRGTTSPMAWDSVHLKTRYITAGGSLYVNIDPWYIAIEEATSRVSISRYVGGNLFMAWDVELPSNDWIAADIVALPSSVTIKVQGQTFCYRSSDSTLMTSAGIYFAEGAEFRLPEIEVNEVIQPGALAPEVAKRKALEFTVDFYDDLLLTAFNQDMLDEMFRVMKRYHGSRAYWIHHGGRDYGLWQGGAADRTMAESFDLLGEDFLPAAVAAARKAELPLVGVFKPFETSVMNFTSTTIPRENRVEALGGWVERSWKLAAAHPELCQQRRSLPNDNGPVSEIVIRSRRSLAGFVAADVQLYVSEDNASFAFYQGEPGITFSGSELRISNLVTAAPFLALSFSPELARKIENTLPLLATLQNTDGQELEFTYGIAPRVSATADYHLAGKPRQLDFREHGLNFDSAGHGVPSAVWNSRKPLLDLYSPSGSNDVLGLTLGLNAQAPGILSEAEPGTQAWWLSEVESMLDAGVDGVEIRIMNHSNVIDWSLYGFNAPLVEEYHRRYGVDIRHEEFSREKFRELRGEFFTAFLRSASALVRGRGKEFRLHIEDSHQGPAGEPCPMEIAMPWRQWIEEGLCDGVTLKVLDSWTHDKAFGREVIGACRAKAIPVTFSPFIHSAFMELESEALLDSYLSGSYDALNIYEFATLFAFTPEGEVKIVDEAMTNWLKSYPWHQRVEELV